MKLAVCPWCWDSERGHILKRPRNVKRAKTPDGVTFKLCRACGFVYVQGKSGTCRATMTPAQQHWLFERSRIAWVRREQGKTLAARHSQERTGKGATK